MVAVHQEDERRGLAGGQALGVPAMTNKAAVVHYEWKRQMPVSTVVCPRGGGAIQVWYGIYIPMSRPRIEETAAVRAGAPPRCYPHRKKERKATSIPFEDVEFRKQSSLGQGHIVTPSHAVLGCSACGEAPVWCI